MPVGAYFPKDCLDCVTRGSRFTAIRLPEVEGKFVQQTEISGVNGDPIAMTLSIDAQLVA